MKKAKSTSTAKTVSSTEERDEVLANRLVELALGQREHDTYAELPTALQKMNADLRKTIKKCLQQRREQALDEAIERTCEEDIKAWRVLRENVEDLSGTILFRRDEGADVEVNAFVVPLFVHTTGGLRSDQCFQDEEAFEHLRDSFQDGGLESSKASVVLVSHAYHLDEIECIGYCHLNEMVHEAFDAMTRKKTSAADAIARSMRGWPQSSFAPDDNAIELRFLLGFVLKKMDDPFYHVPEKEAAADRYFEARAARFRKWSQQVMPLLQRSLVIDGRNVQIDFLYQDLFHGGVEAALAELEMLRLLSELQHAMEANGVAPEEVKAIVGPMETDEAVMLRVSLHAMANDTPIGAIDTPLNRMENMQNAIAEIADGLANAGIRNIQIAKLFDANGAPGAVRQWS
ncbi:DUF2863 family protein [Noviherbaspirillum cavernae]|uniref:DUF2863 family protein n=1 Tax=Noviherbaspirillum cavernae TaxID=2320862 RepID=A0A418X286_9BURK|nr:DUF2863 family protein [Noviherbaspirillum cavernae]RJG06555.1 DUF2863 family protein [Noviherbaspirillum cavernae]